MSNIDKFSEGQTKAWEKILSWLGTKDKHFVLRGYAGTGKTFLMKELLTLPKVNFVFTAPTNKAAKVLSLMIDHPASTTYSAFGLIMSAEDAELVLKLSDTPPYFPPNTVVVVDEAGMAGTALVEAVLSAQAEFGLKVLWTGDPAQLTPVGERKSPAWGLTGDPKCRALLTEVLRFDNQLLALSLKLRHCIKTKDYRSPIKSDHDDAQGVWKYSRSKFNEKLLQAFSDPQALDSTRVLCWRNRTVNTYNDSIRSVLGYTAPFVKSERLLTAAPVQLNGKIISHTDDEHTVTDVYETVEYLRDGTQIPVYKLGTLSNLLLVIPKSPELVSSALSKLADVAKVAPKRERRTAWQTFWNTKNTFNSVRYAYAMTVHRAQGSTYQNVWVDQQDILANRDSREAFRCLYVSATRPSLKLFTY